LGLGTSAIDLSATSFTSQFLLESLDINTGGLA
jgi:hypothetical protein